MKKCRLLIAISKSTKKNLIEVAGVPEEKIRVVYYGVNSRFQPAADSADLDAGKREILEKHGLPGGSLLLLQVATATRYKNTPAILHALAALSRRNPGLRLLRVGAPLFPDEEDLAGALGIAGRIVRVGQISDDNLLARYYRAADVFVFPSLWEGFGWPALEALACGTPVVASNVASLPEVVGDAGVCVPPRDAEALAGAIQRLLSDSEARRDLGARALRQASRFTWENCARGTLRAYKEVAGDSIS